MTSRTTTTTITAEGPTPQRALTALLEDPLGAEMNAIKLYTGSSTDGHPKLRGPDTDASYHGFTDTPIELHAWFRAARFGRVSPTLSIRSRAVRLLGGRLARATSPPCSGPRFGSRQPTPRWTDLPTGEPTPRQRACMAQEALGTASMVLPRPTGG